MKLSGFFILLSAYCLGSAARAESVQVAVAANFIKPMEAIVAAFEEETGHEVRLSFGSSGNFFAQIVNGAPFDVLLSADTAIPEALEQASMAVPGSRFTYATGRLVLWSRAGGIAVADGSVLREGRFRRLAIANPRLAPYGRAAIEVLRGLGLEGQLDARFVQGESIAQAYQFVATGNAELGFVALSQVIDSSSGSAWIVPENLHSAIRQDAVLLQAGKDNVAAHQLLVFLQGSAARSVMVDYGYGSSD